jgi:hypothetical protein
MAHCHGAIMRLQSGRRTAGPYLNSLIATIRIESPMATRTCSDPRQVDRSQWAGSGLIRNARRGRLDLGSNWTVAAAFRHRIERGLLVILKAAHAVRRLKAAIPLSTNRGCRRHLNGRRLSGSMTGPTNDWNEGAKPTFRLAGANVCFGSLPDVSL